MLNAAIENEINNDEINNDEINNETQNGVWVFKNVTAEVKVQFDEVHIEAATEEDAWKILNDQLLTNADNVATEPHYSDFHVKNAESVSELFEDDDEEDFEQSTEN